MEQKKQYYIDNKKQIKEQIKQYQIDNKEQIKEQKKRYYIDNKEKVNERQSTKIICNICNKQISQRNISKHQKSKKCLEKLCQ